jgi:hypothetical protein
MTKERIKEIGVDQFVYVPKELLDE